ncbi:MAG: hypothetical protein JW741_31250 [Sedimentisphaerales bacterium]|nr:hypothetical protein [Sedimentisphaerales bacterium]
MARLTSARLALALMALSALTASVRAQELDPKRYDPNGFLPPEWEGYSDVLDGVYSRLGEQIYVREGAEITPWMKSARLPSPDNAALLWYQAFLSRPEPDGEMSRRINDILRGGEPDGQIRAYLGYCRQTIRLAEMAAQIPQCTWGWSLPDGTVATMQVGGQARQLTFLLAVDARTLAFDGHYGAALARCLTTRGLARHVGDDTLVTFFLSMAIDAMARGVAQYTLDLMPPETDTLRWLRGQMAAMEGVPESLGRVLQMDFEFVLDSLRTDAELLQGIREQLAEDAVNEQAREEAWNLTDEEIVARAREAYAPFLAQILHVVDSEMSYEQKYEEIERRGRELAEQYGSDPAAGYAVNWCQAHRIERSYGLLMHDRASYNALKAAIEVYTVVAETGALPETLPLYLPKDPFSGEPFAYEITDDGFILRCRARDLYSSKQLIKPGEPPEILEDVIQEYEFKVRR